MPSTLASRYLALYNTVSAILRTYILARTVYLWSTSGHTAVFDELNVVTRWAETVAGLEVLHSAAKLVRANPATAALQIGGRVIIVWAIVRNYPDVISQQWAYASLLLAWNVADAVRFWYFCLGTEPGPLQSILVWIRYNQFLVFYPIGFLSEMWLVYSVIEPSKARNTTYQYLLWFGLANYIPGSYILYSHMLSQRKKALAGTGKPSSNHNAKKAN